MSTAKKLLDAMRRNPMDWRIEQIQTVAFSLGIEVRSDGGSHRVFSHPVAGALSVPAHRPIKPVYVRQFVALCDKIRN